MLPPTTRWGWPILYRNQGDGTFADVALQTGVAYTEDGRAQAGMGSDAGDYDGDGFLDLITTNFDEDISMLYRAAPSGNFSDISYRAGLGENTTYLGWGTDFFDYDNDGDLDIFVNNMGDSPSLFENRGGNQGSFLTVRTRGTASNRDGIGAKIMMTAGGRKQFKEVRAGSSFLSQSDLRLHFGLGEAEQVDLLEVWWPSGKTQSFKDIPANQFLTVTEGEGISQWPVTR